MKRIEQVKNYYKKYGGKLTALKILDRHKEPTFDYNKWLERHSANEKKLISQSKKVFRKEMLLSIAVPVYHTPEIFLREMIESIQKQSYKEWELCIADGSENKQNYDIICEYAEKDTRIKVQYLGENKGIADNTNAAIDMCTGAYIGLMDHDDVLPPEALYEVRKSIEENLEPDVIYTDEDKISMDGSIFFAPHFKSDFNEELLRSNNYICHLLFFKHDLLEKTGGMCNEYDGAQDYDFILKCTENAESVVHIPKILYHWRSHTESTAENPESKAYAYDAGKRAIEGHLQRQGEQAEVFFTDYPGFYHVRYMPKERGKVTIFIIDDAPKQLSKCLKLLKRTMGYSNYEIKIKKNWADIQRTDVTEKYVLLMSSSVHMITQGWLEEMLGCCQRKNVGAVGIKIYHKNETIYHAGIVQGMTGYAFEGWPRVRSGYFHRDSITQNLSGVTKKFMMISGDVLKIILNEDAAGLKDERMLCRKILEKGKTIIYNPGIEAYMSSDDAGHSEAQFPEGKKDKYYNENLSLLSPGYSIKE